MEEEKRLPVKISLPFLLDLDEVFNYGLETFGLKQAENYENEIWELIERLPNSYHLFPECRHLPTRFENVSLDYSGCASDYLSHIQGGSTCVKNVAFKEEYYQNQEGKKYTDIMPHPNIEPF